MTHEWHCARCDTRNWMPVHGGTFPNKGRCHPHCAADDQYIWIVVDGKRTLLGRLDELHGS